MRENSKAGLSICFSGFPVFKSEIHAFIPFLLFCTYRCGFLIIQFYREGGSMENRTNLLQWHPAFFAGIQVDLDAEKSELIYNNEYQLGTKPKQIDVIVLKKKDDYQIRKNIGRIFRKYNIIEYKSPSDYLCIDDFYNGYAYACLYKIDTITVDERKIRDITLTFATTKYPLKLMKHLEWVQYYQIHNVSPGIYYICGDIIPIQIVVLSQLPLEENLWLRVLSNKLDDPEIIERMLQEYEQHKDNPLYSSIVEIVAQANQLLFRKEGSIMSETLEAIINEKLDARERKTRLAVNQEHARNMYNIGISVEQIALITKSSVETVNEWLNNKGA